MFGVNRTISVNEPSRYEVLACCLGILLTGAFVLVGGQPAALIMFGVITLFGIWCLFYCIREFRNTNHQGGVK